MKHTVFGGMSVSDGFVYLGNGYVYIYFLLIILGVQVSVPYIDIDTHTLINPRETLNTLLACVP